MNLAGIRMNRDYTIEVLGDAVKNSITRQGNIVAMILREIGKDLRRDGYEIKGAFHKGFTAHKDGSTIQIEIS